MTTSSTVTECCDMQAVNIAPAQINPQPELGALLQAAPLAPHIDPSQISVYIKETLPVSYDINNSDEMQFNIVFNVSEFTEGGESKFFSVTKVISVSKTRLLADGVQVQAAIPATVIESVVEKKEDNSKAVQRMRELAGIPHNKNYV